MRKLFHKELISPWNLMRVILSLLVASLALAFFPSSPRPASLGIISLDFSGERAFKHLRSQVALGPRVPGTQAHFRTRNYIKSQLKAFADEIAEQNFTVRVDGKTAEMTNLIAYLNKGAERFILLGAHYDTRPFADMEASGSKNSPIPGADDGASGVAVLLELAPALKESLPKDTGIVLVFFDGEDFGRTLSSMFLGSKHFARALSAEMKRKIAFGLIVDMVGDRGLAICREFHSEGSIPGVFGALLELQNALGVDVLRKDSVLSIYDDHLPLIEAGIKTYLLIDFDYPYWHTLEDTPDKCSASSLQAVGLLVLNLVLNYAQGNMLNF